MGGPRFAVGPNVPRLRRRKVARRGRLPGTAGAPIRRPTGQPADRGLFRRGVPPCVRASFPHLNHDFSRILAPFTGAFAGDRAAREHPGSELRSGRCTIRHSGLSPTDYGRWRALCHHRVGRHGRAPVQPGGVTRMDGHRIDSAHSVIGYRPLGGYRPCPEASGLAAVCADTTAGRHHFTH